MIQQISKEVKKIFESISITEKGKIFEQIFIAKYGTYENAQEAINNLKQAYPNEEDFCLAIEKELHIDALKHIFRKFDDIDSLPKMINYQHDGELGNIQFDVSKEQAEGIYNLFEGIKPFLPSILMQGHSKITEALFVEKLSKKIRFTLIEIRNEIGISQKTFTKWLHLYFGIKYDGRRTISLVEYIEIYQQLMLKEEEHKFDFKFDNEKYFERINDGLVFSKERLLELTGSDYKTLQANCEKIIPDYKNLDIYPFRLAYKILEKMG